MQHIDSLLRKMRAAIDPVHPSLLGGWLRLFSAGCLVAAGMALSGCNTPTKAVDSVSTSEPAADPASTDGEQASASDQPSDGEKVADAAPAPEIIRKPSTVSTKGTGIRAVVNGEAITSYDIQKRAAFLRLRRVPGNVNDKALEELVDQAIRMQEAKRRNVVASDAQVNDSFAGFAKSNRMTPAQMTTVLANSGVTAEHFKEFVRGQISWNRVVGSKFREDTTGKSTQELMFELRQSGEAKPTTEEYLLQQTIFVIPDARRKAELPKRRKEAEEFRQRFTNCAETQKNAIGMIDVTVRNLGRSIEPQLPQEWLEDIKATAVGSTTPIKDTEKGVEFIAVCSKRTVSDDRAVEMLGQAKEFESFNEKGSEVADALLAELKSKSKIIYR
jgi:peptidyl-prolyl cis-trans isomerase SurA